MLDGRVTMIGLLLCAAWCWGGQAATFRMDPVELVNGNEVAGDESIAAERWQYRYLFVNEKNRMEFEARPEKYEIQLGGACGRMGILSGEGDVDRYAVYQGKIYLFASDQCRRTFLFEPGAQLDHDDPPLTTDESASAKGLELIERAVEAMGGAERLDGLHSYREVVEKKVKTKERDNRQANSLSIVFPASLRRDEEWNEKRWTWIDAPEGARYETSEGDRRELQPIERWAMRRTLLNRHPIAILKARRDPGIVVAYAGSRTIQHRAKVIRVEEVHVWIEGSMSTLGFDTNTGLLRTQSFRGRQTRLGTMLRVFTEHKEVDGLRVPVAWDLQFEGEFKEMGSTLLTTVRLDEPEASERLR